MIHWANFFHFPGTKSSPVYARIYSIAHYQIAHIQNLLHTHKFATAVMRNWNYLRHVSRANGRLANSSYNERHQTIILEKFLSVAFYLIFLHQLTIHGNYRSTQQMVRREFYIPLQIKKSIFMCKSQYTNRKRPRRSC